MAKIVSVSFSEYVYEQYLQTTNKLNRSKYIEEMFIKGVNSELGEFQGVQAKAIEALKQVRARDEQIANLQRELAAVKSKVITQEKKRQEREAKLLQKQELRNKERVLDGLTASGIFESNGDVVQDGKKKRRIIF